MLRLKRVHSRLWKVPVERNMIAASRRDSTPVAFAKEATFSVNFFVPACRHATIVESQWIEGGLEQPGRPRYQYLLGRLTGIKHAKLLCKSDQENFIQRNDRSTSASLFPRVSQQPYTHTHTHTRSLARSLFCLQTILRNNCASVQAFLLAAEMDKGVLASTTYQSAAASRPRS